MKIDLEGAYVVDPEEYLSERFAFGLSNIIPDVPPKVYVGLTNQSATSAIDRIMYGGKRKRDELNTAEIISAIENALNSNETFVLAM